MKRRKSIAGHGPTGRLAVFPPSLVQPTEQRRNILCSTLEPLIWASLWLSSRVMISALTASASAIVIGLSLVIIRSLYKFAVPKTDSANGNKSTVFLLSCIRGLGNRPAWRRRNEALL
jgi:hypothetical protein